MYGMHVCVCVCVSLSLFTYSTNFCKRFALDTTETGERPPPAPRLGATVHATFCEFDGKRSPTPCASQALGFRPRGGVDSLPSSMQFALIRVKPAREIAMPSSPRARAVPRHAVRPASSARAGPRYATWPIDLLRKGTFEENQGKSRYFC